MATSSWDSILAYVAKRIDDACGVAVEASELIPPPKPDMGDVAFGCFRIAKVQGKNPAEVAKEIVAKLSKDQTIESVSAAGPYVNVMLKTGALIHGVIGDAEQAGATYGSSDDGKKKQMMLEYAQPNTHKEIHVGHLRNLVLGPSLAKLLKLNGWDTVRASYHGDVGAHVAKCLWHVQRTFGKKQIPADKQNAKFLGQMYAEASKMLEEQPGLKDEVSEVQRKLESHDPVWEKLWLETREWSLEEMKEVFAELGVEIDRQYLESEVVDEGQRIVDELLKKKIAKESQGAIIVDLEQDKLGVFLVRKSDGTSLYATKDLALAQKKVEEYPKLVRSLMVVDNRQSLYFKQLFRTLDLMGFKQKLEFVGYEFVTLKSGAMSSREGNIVTYEQFRDEVVEYARKETSSRHEDWSKKQIDQTAWALAMGGIKFGMLRQDSDKVYTFDMEKALSFDGDTGPYIQYAATRMASILKKAGKVNFKKADLTMLEEAAEKRLALQVAQFPEVCRKAALELRPTFVAQWCITTAQRMSDFYRDVKVLEAPAGVKEARLRLIAAVRSVLGIGLDLLGIPLPDEM